MGRWEFRRPAKATPMGIKGLGILVGCPKDQLPFGRAGTDSFLFL